MQADTAAQDDGGANFCPIATTRIKAREARALIVEDHPVNQLLLNKLLIKFGFGSVDVAEHGEIALDIMANNPPFDIIFMDCQMPVMDGYETTRQIRLREAEASASTRVHIVAMTANAMLEDHQKCTEAGMDDYLTKPIDPRKLDAFLSQRFISAAQMNVVASALEQDSKPIDSEVIGLMCDSAEELRYVLDLFFNLGEQKLEEMRMHCRIEEQKTWAAAAHYLKGSAASMGMSALSKLCLEAEQQKSVTYDEKKVLLERIVEEFNRARAYAQHLATEMGA
jgi:CheY-like chemotaxis protein